MNPRRRREAAIALAVTLVACMFVALANAQSDAAAGVQRGRYLVLIGHCNNCHTAGYAQTEGAVPEDRWLTGNPVGWRARGGTTYAANLRVFMDKLSEDDWLKVARTIRSRPPMPWWSLRDTNDADLKAMYAYIRSLSPLGLPAPAFLPPDQAPKPPFIQQPDMSVGPSLTPAAPPPQ